MSEENMSELNEDWWKDFIKLMLISFGAMSARVMYDKCDCPHQALISEWRRYDMGAEEYQIHMQRCWTFTISTLLWLHVSG